MNYEEESVYNLIERGKETVHRPAMHRSKHPHDTPPTFSTFISTNTSKPGVTNVQGSFVDPDHDGGQHKMKRGFATMGRPVRQTIDTMSFTKKRSGEMSLPQPSRFEYTDRLKPAVPTRDEKPIMGLVTTKNFIVSNAVENILSVAKKRPEKEMNWTQKPEYGQIPSYLHEIKKEIEEEYAYIHALQERHTQREGRPMRLLTHSERDELLEGLKQRYEDLRAQYNNCNFAIPAPKKKDPAVAQLDRMKVQKKERFESEMEQLEKSIAKLSKENIFVYDDAEQYTM